jgi:hypothetical protein
MVTRDERSAVRTLAVGLLTAGLLGMAAFSWLVVISWDVLRQSLGLTSLVLLVVLSAVAAATWASVLVRKVRRPTRPALTRTGRTGVAALSLLAVAAGLVAVPSTRARLESNKCQGLAASDAAAQVNCRTWLETRREWWTFGLSHADPTPPKPN